MAASVLPPTTWEAAASQRLQCNGDCELPTFHTAPKCTNRKKRGTAFEHADMKYFFRLYITSSTTVWNVTALSWSLGDNAGSKTVRSVTANQMLNCSRAIIAWYAGHQTQGLVNVSKVFFLLLTTPQA